MYAKSTDILANAFDKSDSPHKNDEMWKWNHSFQRSFKSEFRLHKSAFRVEEMLS